MFVFGPSGRIVFSTEVVGMAEKFAGGKEEEGEEEEEGKQELSNVVEARRLQLAGILTSGSSRSASMPDKPARPWPLPL